MANKKIIWWEPQIGRKERELVNQVLDGNYINEGELTKEFEQRLAQILEVKHAIAATSGTVAIFLALKALGVGPGDEVIVPDITFVATANAVDLCGAKVVLADVDPQTLNLDPDALIKTITNKTKAVIPVHYTGRAADMESIKQICRQKSLAIIEDAAEALLSKYQGKYLGTIGQAGCFSFSPNKTITTGQGGLVVTNDDALAIRIGELKNQGRPSEGGDVYNSRGYNFRLTNLQAAIGLGQLAYLNDRVERMKNIRKLYEENLQSVKGISLIPFDVASGIPQWTDALIENRDELIAYLQTHQVECRAFWLPLHQQKPYKSPDTNFPHSTTISKKAVWLPSCFTLSDEDVLYVCKLIRDFSKRN